MYSIHTNYKFTIEVESQRQLRFLDVMSKRKPGGYIGNSVYRKPTHPYRYLNGACDHHPAQNSSGLNTLINRL